MRTVSKMWKNFYKRLGQINPECPLENKVVKQTMRIQEYIIQVKIVIEELNPQDSILEIGCGFGGFALEMLKLRSVKYTVVDNRAMLLQAKKYLGDRVEYIEAGKIETLQGRKFGLFVSHYCLSETPPEYRRYILENIIKNCQKISIRDLDDAREPTPEMLNAGYEMIPLDIEKWVKKYFIFKKTKHQRRKDIMLIGDRRR